LKQLLGNEDVQKTELLARIDVMNQFIEEYMDTATKTISKQDEILASFV
jgi:transcription elongation factor Elf1